MLLNALPALNRNISTLIGLTAVIFWSTNVGLIRSVSESFGAVAGAALIYSVASVILLFTIGMPKFSTIPKSYLCWGSLLFVAYELCFALSIGYAQNSRQAIEVGMINYLWPTFTLLFAIIFNNIKANILIIPGCILALVGICWVLGGDTGFDLFQIWTNLKANPLSYGLAFAAAMLSNEFCAAFNLAKSAASCAAFAFALLSAAFNASDFALSLAALIAASCAAVALAAARAASCAALAFLAAIAASCAAFALAAASAASCALLKISSANSASFLACSSAALILASSSAFNWPAVISAC